MLAELAQTGDSELQRALARETVARVEAGDVLLFGIEDAKGRDLWHMCKDVLPERCPAEPPEDDWVDEEVLGPVVADLDGYMWGNRLYFAFRQGQEPAPRELAATLVHEVNHVLNRSECSYYSDLLEHEVDDTLAYVEEFRAFLAECALERGVEAAAELCAQQADEALVERGYGLEPDLSLLFEGGEGDSADLARAIMAPDSQHEAAFGSLVPTWDSWPDSFEPCGD